MIGKAHSGAGFGGLTRYLLTGKKDDPRPDRVLWTSTRELALEAPRDAAALMRSTAALGRTDRPLQHFSISLAPGEHLTREQWEQVIDTTMRDLGLEGHQALIVAHQDTAHEHIHLMVNRVHPETHRAWDRWQDRPRLMASLRPQEIALGLQPTPYNKNPDRLPDGLVQQFERTGEPPLLDYARSTARSIFREAQSWSALHERLADEGLYLERRGQGLVISDDHRQVKASSVDRSASLRALEARLGPYEERRPLLQEVNQALQAEVRERELAAELAPLRTAYQERTLAIAARDSAESRLKSTEQALVRTLGIAFREPGEASSRYLSHLQAGGAPEVPPVELGRLRGSVLQTGRFYLPVGREGERSYHVAVEQVPRLGSAYRDAQVKVTRSNEHLASIQLRLERLEERFRPQLAELRNLETIERRNLPEDVLFLRPRDQVALARRYGAGIVDEAAERAPDMAVRTVAAREQWMRKLAPPLNRALDRQLSRRRLPAPVPGRSAAWLERALESGLKPAHGLQALARAGVPLTDTLQATSRALSRTRKSAAHPAKAAVSLTAKALGLPSFALRVATISLSMARSLAQTLSR